MTDNQNTQPTTLLPRLRMRGLRAHSNARGGVAWSGTILLDDEPRLVVSNDGRGGSNMYCGYEADEDALSARALVDAIELQARAATGLRCEAFDALTACMENGDTAEQAVAVVRASFGTGTKAC
jgi:hypothetical protein